MSTAVSTKAQQGEVLVEVRNLKKHFPVTGGGIIARTVGWVKAVDGVSFQIRRGETLGLVGESGCGKTTLGKVLLRLQEPTDGQVLFEGRNIYDLNREQMRKLRREMQIIFQDPYASLNPRMTVGDIIGEPLEIHGVARGAAKTKKVHELLDVVGLASFHARRYPHEFSGGQRQRIGIARALALNPKLIVCDEPVSALDVSIQSQVLNLLEDLQKEFGLTYLFIAHGLAVVKHVSDRVGVMYLGKMMEISPADELYANPLHPYTEALMSAIPIPDPTLKRERIVLEGDVPSPVNPPKGCRFHTRCRYQPQVGDICKTEEPPLINVGGDHWVACHMRTSR
ncbi:oligopeptide/dipeptide ABC transporter ATP-binding protein [Symbiobacterium terraclitae]|uniref:Oligopeptide/dipeptide ABC transporter ATP-binding protein n=1 Tax=Symbiobacterium terraclitae TaxID=557451 RepID=A0ABS4JUI1_9FIRM|nr:dipeptide ABC transporter ATP-binding protein [Symbiobacterium terraclitae]MBP2019222.1 oligopeptide/dipeptide ABC transporter ATP-binding protein [Symbiobacterium terraclitae]